MNLATVMQVATAIASVADILKSILNNLFKIHFKMGPVSGTYFFYLKIVGLRASAPCHNAAKSVHLRIVYELFVNRYEAWPTLGDSRSISQDREDG